MRGPNSPGGEFFLGYSYVRFQPNTALVPGGPTLSEQFDMIPGGVAQITGNINNWFGLMADFGIYNVWDVRNVEGRFFTYLFGPRFTYRKHKWSVFGDALGGGARVTSSLSGPPTTRFFNHSFHANAAAAAAGGGFDFNASKHIAIRLGEVEYLLTTFTDNSNNRQNNFRVSGGLVFRFGFPAPPPPPRPPTATCTATPSTVHQETTEVAVIRAEAVSPAGRPLTYTWSATGGSVEGTGPEVRWNPGSAAVGSYTVTARVNDGAGGIASCTAEVHLEPRPNRPPVVSSVAASPATIRVGEKSTVTCTASDPDNDPLTYTWSTTGGTITGTGPTAQFDSTGLTAGHYTVTCHVDDGRGGTADGKADIEVQPPRALEMRLALHSVYFSTALPTVQAPTAGLAASQERTLSGLADDFKKYLTFKPDAYLTLRGHADPRGSVAYNQALSERRVARVKSFLVEQGVPESAIKTEAVGKERQISPAEVKQMTEQDPAITAQQKAAILRNLRTIALAQNRRVDVVLSTTGQTSTRLYPFNAADAASLLSPKGPPAAKKPPAKKPPAKRAPAPPKKP